MKNSLWLGPSPGLRGWLLQLAGLLGPRVSEPAIGVDSTAPHWKCTCPLCSGTHARIWGPAASKPLARGHILCADCVGAYGHDDDSSSAPADFMAEEYDEAADAALVRRLGGGTVEGWQGAARAELQDILPRVIDLASEREVVIREAVAALYRYDVHGQNPYGILLDIARWRREGKPISELPAWVGDEVSRRIARGRALELLINAFDRTTLLLGREWLYARELAQHEPFAVEEVKRLLEWDHVGGKSRGWLLKRFEVRPGELLGLRASTKRGPAGKRWTVVRLDPRK